MGGGGLGFVTTLQGEGRGERETSDVIKVSDVITGGGERERD